MKKPKYKYKNYGHFDNKISPHKVQKLVENPTWVSKHGFYPLFHMELNFNKISKNLLSKEIIRKPKKRNIYYSSHIDRYIYQHYSYLLNNKYNDYTINKDINNNSIAYRTNLGKNNIHFANEVFNYISKSKTCYIIVGDFKDFFDNLNHKYLKDKLKEVLIADKLTNDWYKVFKSVTKYHFIDYVDLSKFKFGKVISKTRKEKFFQDIRTIDKYKNEKNIYSNPNDKGIPQGLPISATLSNVYMINADQELKKLSDKYDGLYRRYSDDFIFVVRTNDFSKVKMIFNNVITIINNIPDLDLQPDKTGYYLYENNAIQSVNEIFSSNKNSLNKLDYLGFTLDESGVSIRGKTMTKYFYKLNRYINKSVNLKSKFTFRKLFVRYSADGIKIKDKNGKLHNNFITYYNNSNKIFNGIVGSKFLINHKKNILKRYNKIISGKTK